MLIRVIRVPHSTQSYVTYPKQSAFLRTNPFYEPMWLKKKLKQVQLDKFASSSNAKQTKLSAKILKISIIRVPKNPCQSKLIRVIRVPFTTKLCSLSQAKRLITHRPILCVYVIKKKKLKQVQLDKIDE